MRTSWVAMSVALVVTGTGFVLAWREEKSATRRAVHAEARISRAEALRDSAEEIRVRSSKDFQDRIGALHKRVGEIEAVDRRREEEMQAARAEVERKRRLAEDEFRRREAAEAEVLRWKAKAEATPPVAPKPETAKPEIVKPAPEKPKVVEPAPAPTLGPTAVTDANQVRKVTDGLNTLLAGVGGTETWRIASAKAIEDERLVEAVLEARNGEGGVAKTLAAAEARFVLQAAAGTLTLKLREGTITYPGNRTVPFPDGAYAVILVVDPGPFRSSGNPLVHLQ